MLALPRSAYAARREAILERLPDGAAMLLPTNPERLRAGDSHFPFRPGSDFYYATGFGEPEAWALIKKGGVDAGFTLIVLPKNPEREVWTGIRFGTEGAREEFGADHAFSTDDLEKELGRLLTDVQTLYFSFGRHPEVEPLLTRVLNTVRGGRKAHKGPTSIADAGLILTELRLHKTADELALMRRGAEITDEAHTEAMRQVRPGMHEYEIQALVEYTFRRHGAWGWAYPSIVGGGANACILHYVLNNGRFGDSDLMLIDAGAEVDGYATDVTRTSPVSGQFTGAQRDLYQLILDVQEAAVQATKPGHTLDAMHDDVVRGLTSGLIDLGLLTGSVDEAIEEKTFRRYYMHRTSHWLGLDVHDVGRYLLDSGEGRPLEPGMVLTIEPGLYIAPNDEKAPEAFRGIGIRIEDDVLVTEQGHENLTAAIPKTIEAIEALRA
jgi:Xaa-Pro aminopeptidase